MCDTFRRNREIIDLLVKVIEIKQIVLHICSRLANTKCDIPTDTQAYLMFNILILNNTYYLIKILFKIKKEYVVYIILQIHNLLCNLITSFTGLTFVLRKNKDCILFITVNFPEKALKALVMEHKKLKTINEIYVNHFQCTLFAVYQEIINKLRENIISFSFVYWLVNYRVL